MSKLHPTTLLTMTLLFLSPLLADELKDDIDIEELQDRSHFKDYSMLKKFYIVDMEPINQSYYYFYYFNMLAKSNRDEKTEVMTQNEFYFDMYYYNRKYPESPLGPTVDWTDEDATRPIKGEIKGKMISAFKINPDFYKAEISIPKNDCLTLFFFLDSEEETSYTLFPSRHDVYFDMRKSKANNFSEAVDSFYGHANESFDLIYNDLDYEGDLFLKVVCPYFSNFGNDEISLSVQFIPEGYSFEGSLPFWITCESQ